MKGISKKKGEIQERILPEINSEADKATDEEFFSVLKMISPGTHIRTGLNSALKLGKGALIALKNERFHGLMDGGFKINCRFTPTRLVELTKMDGAIVLSNDGKRIEYANVLLTPSAGIKTSETGTRHKAAERTAKQVGTLVLAISEKRREITLYYKNRRYPLRDTGEILRKANEHIQILEKQRELYDSNLKKLDKTELRGVASLNRAIQVIQKGQLIHKIEEDLKRYIIETGNEGTILKTRLKEISLGVDKEVELVMKDYTKLNLKKSRILLKSLSYEDLLEKENIMKVLAYEEIPLKPKIKGWRILSKTCLKDEEVVRLVRGLGFLKKILNFKDVKYPEIIGESRFEEFKEDIEKIKVG